MLPLNALSLSLCASVASLWNRQFAHSSGDCGCRSRSDRFHRCYPDLQLPFSHGSRRTARTHGKRLPVDRLRFARPGTGCGRTMPRSFRGFDDRWHLVERVNPLCFSYTGKLAVAPCVFFPGLGWPRQVPCHDPSRRKKHARRKKTDIDVSHMVFCRRREHDTFAMFPYHKR